MHFICSLSFIWLTMEVLSCLFFVALLKQFTSAQIASISPQNAINKTPIINNISARPGLQANQFARPPLSGNLGGYTNLANTGNAQLANLANLANMANAYQTGSNLENQYANFYNREALNYVNPSSLDTNKAQIANNGLANANYIQKGANTYNNLYGNSWQSQGNNIANSIAASNVANGLNPNVATFNYDNGQNQFSVTSGSPGSGPFGIQVVSDALEVTGTVAVSGIMPIYGSVVLNGNLPSEGSATVNYGCSSQSS